MKSNTKIRDGAAESCATSLVRQSVRRRCGPKRTFERQGEFSPPPAPVLLRPGCMPPDQIVAIRRELTPARNALKAKAQSSKRQGLTNLINMLDNMLKEPDNEGLHAAFPKRAADFVRLNGGFK